jgi:NAD(P)H-hydrate epimerase
LLVIAGSDAYRGAARLCLEGASASGCGSLRAAVPEAVAASLWQTLPHVVVSDALPSRAAGDLELAAVQPHTLERLDAVVLGPGLGARDHNPPPGAGDAAFWRTLQGHPGLLLVDADGLNRLSRDRHGLAWLQQRRGPTWITPHAGEFRRLFAHLAERPPLEAASAAATASGCGVLLKGARTVIAAPDGRCWQLGWAEPAAARAGLGDVLAGYAAGLGAKALAAGGEADPELLAAAALAHAWAGRSGGAPMAIAHALQTQP